LQFKGVGKSKRRTTLQIRLNTHIITMYLKYIWQATGSNSLSWWVKGQFTLTLRGLEDLPQISEGISNLVICITCDVLQSLCATCLLRPYCCLYPNWNTIAFSHRMQITRTPSFGTSVLGGLHLGCEVWQIMCVIV
jgi:hypothetical protein